MTRCVWCGKTIIGEINPRLHVEFDSVCSEECFDKYLKLVEECKRKKICIDCGEALRPDERMACCFKCANERIDNLGKIKKVFGRLND